MEGYIKGSLCTSITVNINVELEASIQGYSKDSLGPSKMVN
jgi:hypothetical protein